MTKLSEFKRAADLVDALNRLRHFRHAYGANGSPPKRAIIELDCANPPRPVTLSASTRSALNLTLEHEEATLTAELRGLGVTIDTDLPL